MSQTAITFENYNLPQALDPARMDVACFIGFIGERADTELPESLAEELSLTYRVPRESLLGSDRLRNRAVSVTSVQAFETLFDPDARLEQRAVVEGGTLAEGLPQSGIDPVLYLVVNGLIREVDLTPLPSTPDELVTRIQNAGLGLEVSLGGEVGSRTLRIALPAAWGPGTLAVLPHPTYGFRLTRRARARALPSVLGQGVRQFFAMGGRKAVIVRIGDPLPYDIPRHERYAALIRLLSSSDPGDQGDRSLIGPADVQRALADSLPKPVIEAEQRYGITQVYGLPDTTFLLLPDLPELVAAEPELASQVPGPVLPEEVFDKCLPAAGDVADAQASMLRAPVIDTLGISLWYSALERILGMLRRYQRDKLLIAAVPRATAPLGVATAPRSAFLQLAEGWARTAVSQAAPGQLMAPDALLVGHLAGTTLLRGTYLSAAPVPMVGVRDVEAVAVQSELSSCRIRRDLRGFFLSADLTASADPMWIDGPVSRLMAMLLRQCQELGEGLVFEPSNEALWARVEGALGGLLEAMWRQGALAGSGEGDSYSVRCDATTMSHDDIDAGRLIAEISFRPAVPISRIQVRLPITGSVGTAIGQGGPE